MQRVKKWFGEARWNICFYCKETRNWFRRMSERLGIWLSYWKVTKGVYDFDYSGILEVERHQLLRTIASITKYQNHVDWERDVFWMKTCVSLLDIILGKEDWWHIDVADDRPMFHEEEDGTYTLSEDYMSSHTYRFDKYVNTRNARRFFKNLPEGWEAREFFIPDLREAKAWDLYCKIRKEHLFEWWD